MTRDGTEFSIAQAKKTLTDPRTWFTNFTAPPVISAIAALMGTNVTGNTKQVKGNTDESVVSAVFLVFPCVGYFVGPQLWRPQDAP